MSYLLDAWSLAHFVGWGVAAYIVARCGASLRKIVVLALCTGLGWEFFESYLAQALALYDEPWYNRWLSDPIIDLVGAAAGWKVANHVN